MFDETFWVAFGLTMFAGLSTGIGSLLAFVTKRTNVVFLSFALGFSAGVMLYISFVEMLQEAIVTLSEVYGEKTGTIHAISAFFGGVLLIAIIDRLVPDSKNPHEIVGVESHTQKEYAKKRGLVRMGLFSAIAIAIHNFPEGMAVFFAGMHNIEIAIPVAVAIAIHNIPEGIAVSAPIYYATGSRRKAFLLSFASGLAEPAGAIIGYLFLAPYFSDTVFGILFAAVAGIMVFISLDELLPTAREYGKTHTAIYGLILGMLVMAISLVMFM